MSETATEDKKKAGNGAKAAGGELIKKGNPDADLLAIAGGDDGFEMIQTGGVSKWLNLKAFQADPNAATNVAVKANGKYFKAALLSRQEMTDENSAEENADGVRVRYFYNVRLLTPCPVTVKDENGQSKEEMAQPGEIISVGERHALKALKEMAEDGGQYVVVIRPHSRIKIGGGHTMWTFDMAKKTIRPPVKIVHQAAKTPF